MNTGLLVFFAILTTVALSVCISLLTSKNTKKEDQSEAMNNTSKEDVVEEYTPPYYCPEALYVITIVVFGLLTLLFGCLSYSTKIKRKRWGGKLTYGIVALLLFVLVITFIVYWIDDRKQIKLRGFSLDPRDEKTKISDEERYNTEINNNIGKVKVNLGGIPVLYINLDRSSDRRERLEAEREKFDIDLIRVPGVEGSTLKWERGKFETPYGDIEYINKFSPKNNSCMGELGCTLAHHKAIYTARYLDLPYALILEDDATLEHLALIKETIPSILSRAPDDWEIINLLSPSCKSEKNPHAEFKAWQDSFSTRGIAGIGRTPCYPATAYIINKKGIDKLARNDPLILKPNALPDNVTYPLDYKADNYIFGMTNSYICSTPTILLKSYKSTLDHNETFITTIFGGSADEIGGSGPYRDSVIREVLKEIDTE